jgi:hypothetical protein
MNTQSQIYARFVVLCGMALMAGCTANAATEEYAKAYPVNGRVAVHIHVLDARVQVVTTDDPRVEFQVRYDKWEGSDSALAISSRQDGNVVELTANEDHHDWGVWGGFHGRGGVVEVRMPKNADLQVETSNGAIDVSALKGSVRAHTSNGAISVDRVDGDCDLSTSNGRIHAEGRFDLLELHSSNGGIVARAEVGSRVSSGWRIGTSNAGIDLAVPTDLKADLDAGTSNGGIQLDLPVMVQGSQGRSRVHGALNGGGPEVSVHTSNGHIRLSGV